ncbi:hypothetical protein LEP1GSC198_2638 [Leptospira kirschneri str. JB]|nr:hypothetical protein LEP1GSC198_2638 [Leptospira kirschneri str. JB]
MNLSYSLQNYFFLLKSSRLGSFRWLEHDRIPMKSTFLQKM